MHRQSSLIWLALSAAISASPMLPAPASALEPFCSGHQLLSTPRPEGSCLDLKPQVYPSPDGALRAIVLPVDVSLDASPDMESRVVIRGARGDTVNSKDYSSPRGANGYYVVTAKWSPDSQFFVYSLSSSGGHSPWSFPLAVYSRGKNAFVSFSKMIHDNPTLSSDFSFSGPHTLTATTWKKSGAIDDKVPVSVDLQDAFNKLPPSSD
jgi:hypothetical protein